MTALDFARRNPWLSAQYLTLASVTAVLAWTGQWLSAAAWLLALAVIAGLDAVRARLGTDLDRATAAELVDAITTHQNRTVLLDPGTGDLLLAYGKRLLGRRMWTVERVPGGWETLAETRADLAVGAPLSTVGVVAYVLIGRRISTVDRVTYVRLDGDGHIEPVDDGQRPRFWRDAPFLVRSGIRRVTPGEVSHLLAQLRRAEVQT